MTSAMARILALREADAAAAPEERRRAEMGLDRRIESVEGAKAAFDEAMRRRFGKSARNWTAIAQAIYAGALDDADAARRGEAPSAVDGCLAPRPEFQALVGEGILSLRPGLSGRHLVAWRTAPGAAPVVTGEVMRHADRTLRLVAASPETSAALRHAIETAAASMLAETWRESLCILIDRCSELTMYACLVAAPTMRDAFVPSQTTSSA